MVSPAQAPHKWSFILPFHITEQSRSGRRLVEARQPMVVIHRDNRSSHLQEFLWHIRHDPRATYHLLYVTK